jgi:hypothetical protein
MSELIKSTSNNLPATLDDFDDGTLAVAGINPAAVSKRISIKGGVFRKIVGGKEVAAIEDRHMNVIFVKMAPTPSRTYYKDAYQEGVKIGPTCWSTDAKTPDADVKTPLASSCDSCPMSIDGSGNGGRGKACKLMWRTAVVLPNDVGGDVMQLVIPGGSCWGKGDDKKLPFKPYITSLVAKGTRAGRVVTKMAFDPKGAGQKLNFVAHEYVPEEDLETLARQSRSEAAAKAVKFTVYQTDEAPDAEAPAAAAAPEAIPEPKLREKAEASKAPAADASDLIKKWAKK